MLISGEISLRSKISAWLIQTNIILCCLSEMHNWGLVSHLLLSESIHFWYIGKLMSKIWKSEMFEIWKFRDFWRFSIFSGFFEILKIFYEFQVFLDFDDFQDFSRFSMIFKIFRAGNVRDFLRFSNIPSFLHWMHSSQITFFLNISIDAWCGKRMI